jgi:carbonic anhydrase
MQRLLDGIRKYHDEVFPTQKAELERLMREGQRPEVLAIACSDSRIKLGEITQSGPGELFVVRNAGNIVPPWNKSPSGVAASIEYAVNALPIRDVIVAGHTGCGAMRAVLEPESIRELPAVVNWLRYARKARCPKGGDPMKETTRANVLLQLEHLQTYPCIQKGLEEGRLGLHGWIFVIETGDVEMFNPQTQSWETIT